MKPTIKDFIAKYGGISLLDGEHYKGSLDLRGTQITALPEGLTVGGSLYLRGAQITDISMVNRNLPNQMMWEW